MVNPPHFLSSLDFRNCIAAILDTRAYENQNRIWFCSPQNDQVLSPV